MKKVCYRVGSRIIEKQSGRVIYADASGAMQRGSAVLASDGTVTIIQTRAAPCAQSLARARKFMAAHDRFFLGPSRLVAESGGASISRYLAEFFIDRGDLVEIENGRYTVKHRLVSVPGAMLPAVTAFMEMLARAGD